MTVHVGLWFLIFGFVPGRKSNFEYNYVGRAFLKVIHQKVLKPKVFKPKKGIEGFCKPKGIKGPKVLKVVPK